MQTREVSYAQFKNMLREGKVLEVRMDQKEIRGILYIGRAAGLSRLRAKLQEMEQVKIIDNAPLTKEKQPSLQELYSRLRKLAEQKGDLMLFRTLRVDDPKLVDELDAKGVEYSAVHESVLGQLFWSTILPILFWVGLWFLLIKGMGRPGAGMLSFGKSKAKIAMEKDTGVRFEDVAG